MGKLNVFLHDWHVGGKTDDGNWTKTKSNGEK